MQPGIDSEIARRADFIAVRDALHETVASILCSTTDTLTGNMLFGTIFRMDPDLWFATAYGSIKNNLTVQEASLLLLQFYLVLRVREITKGKIPIRFFLDRSTRHELEKLEAVYAAISPRCSNIRTETERGRFMKDVTLYLTS